MAKKKKRERIPVFDSLIDLAGAAAMDYMIYKRRQKYPGKSSRKIDPYAATGIAMGMGKVKNTDDLLRLGGVLGAMGAFDEDDSIHSDRCITRYAWRLNCQDGTAYGVNPEAYETREEYHQAIAFQKSRAGNTTQNDVASPSVNVSYNTAVESEVFTYCSVELIDSKETRYYRTENHALKVGDQVVVPSSVAGAVSTGFIQSIELYTRSAVPMPVEETAIIYGTI